MMKRVIVFAFALCASAAGAALAPGGWNPSVRERLDALIERNRGNPDAYAVFDFDYTVAIGDLSYVCMWRILERFEFKSGDCRKMLAVGVSPRLKPEAEAIAAIAERLMPFAGTDLTGRAEWREFIRRYWALYRDLANEIGEYRAYLWRVRVFTGYTPDDLRALARDAIAEALASGGLRADANAPTEKRGLVLTPEIKDLFGELRKAGIAAYIVSGSFKDVLAVAVSPEFGLGIPTGNVFGCSLKKDASGRFVPEMEEGGVRFGRKAEFIRERIAPRHHGAEPVLAAGDSMGDYAMLTDFKNLQLALVMRRNWKNPQLRELVERGGRVVAQGRDEVRGCFIPTPESIEPKVARRPPQPSVGFKVDRSAMSDAYWEIWNDDVQAKIDADIEKYRKADASVEVAAPDGTEVKVEQESHAFFFGAHIFNFNQLGKTEWNNRYKELYGTLFNSATVAFYWRTLERYPYAPRFEERYEDTENFWNSCPQPKEQPHWRRPAPDPVVAFLRARGVRIHGHPLVWGSNHWMTPLWLWDGFCPASEKRALEEASGVRMPRPNPLDEISACDRGWSREWAAAWKRVYERLSDEEIARLVPTFLKAQDEFYERRIREIAARYGSRVDSWDVVNESASDFDKFGRRAVRGKPFDRSWYGPMPADYAYKAFMWSQKYMPKAAWLNINEYNMVPFFDQVKDLIANGARIDVVGSQMHLFNPAESVSIARGEFTKEAHAKTHPAAVAERFRVLSQTGRPIHLSEITITAPDMSPRGQMVQAIIMRNLYRAWFSVEKMNGITWWNVVDDCGAPGEPSISGLFTRDMRPKTAYFAMDDLVNREWKTKTAVAAAGGKVSFRGFRGRYRLSWKDADGNEHAKFAEVR